MLALKSANRTYSQGYIIEDVFSKGREAKKLLRLEVQSIGHAHELLVWLQRLDDIGQIPIRREHQ